MIRRKEEPYLTMKKTTSTSLNEKCCETHFFFFFFALKYHGRQLLNYDFYDFWRIFPRRTWSSVRIDFVVGTADQPISSHLSRSDWTLTRPSIHPDQKSLELQSVFFLKIRLVLMPCKQRRYNKVLGRDENYFFFSVFNTPSLDGFPVE